MPPADAQDFEIEVGLGGASGRRRAAARLTPEGRADGCAAATLAALTCARATLNTVEAADPRGRDRVLANPAPKAQPPRKRSGQRTARELALWKAAMRRKVEAPPTDGRNPSR